MKPSRTLIPLVLTLLLAACGGTGTTPPPPTPPAPITPPTDSAPVISSFTASPTNVITGDFVTLSWDVTNAETIRLTPDPGQGDLSAQTGVTVTPTATTTYTLEAISSSGLNDTAAVTVTVDGGQLPGSTLPY
ncbi:MAG: hypothetical protein AVDCRST_MAG86-2525 [uncultured Truepera sp.]|uniref:Fibronectin type-III domain-containing protein n=1 Tax=uncultured Truepera sp. TaxID=543023 RepID=A0A6J4VHK2_9DEIN|nr:MAG: hypothetical protein AVDCRST_MAG86-2525 [uncultured Truepera sp.]